MRQFKIYCDGSCKKGKVGGWAYIIIDVDNNKKILKEEQGWFTPATNNQAEMLGMIHGINAFENFLRTNEIESFTCQIYTDSAYISNCFEEKWYDNWEKNGYISASKTPVKNKELWKQIIPYFKDEHYIIKKVKGHGTDEFNNLVDSYAQSAAKGGQDALDSDSSL